MDDNMDVDPGSSTSSGHKRAPTSPPASSSANKRLKPILPTVQLCALNDAMERISRRNRWQDRIADAQKDASQSEWRGFFSDLLMFLLLELSTTNLKDRVIPPLVYDKAVGLVNDLTGEEFDEWVNGVQTGVKEKDWEHLIGHPKLQARIPVPLSLSGNIASTNSLRAAYDAEFLGDGATNFLEHLNTMDLEAQVADNVIYAKAIPIVQSSGTGKSRMMTEVGKHIFTLPICLRGVKDPGYPLSDKPVLKYFEDVPDDNDLSFTAHHRIACFIAAAHTIMLEWLEGARGKCNGKQLLAVWHEAMEENANDARSKFFLKVVELAKRIRAKNPQQPVGQSSRRNEKGVEPNSNLHSAVKGFYDDITSPATQKLMAFISGLFPEKEKTLCVTYFDEAHELSLRLWVMLRLLQHQLLDVGMWYVFMGTKSSISYYSPALKDQLPLKLREEVQRLVPPYIALGFDHHLTTRGDRKVKNARMGDLESIKHLSQYGRPMWRACFTKRDPQELIRLASFKLTNGNRFNSSDTNHVFAVLSQRICLEPVVAGSEAISLADRSVSHHMRLLTGFSAGHQIFHTHSPSEPMLALGAIDRLYNPTDPKLWENILDTFSKDLCTPGLIDKGDLGELVARTLFILARDYAAPPKLPGRDLLKPVRLLDVMNKLFGNSTWGGLNQETFDNAFGSAYVNYTHWVVTRDPLPEKPDRQLLENLWARGGILQCCHNQSGVDALAAMYLGDVSPDAIFNPALLSGLFLQIKLKVDGDAKAELAMRPVGIPRDFNQPLPYLAILMELGTEANYQATGSKIKSAFSPASEEHGAFKKLTNEWVTAAKDLKSYQRRRKQTEAQIKILKTNVAKKRLAMDSCNRYFVGVRGATADTYGILTTAGVEKSFATLLKVVMSAPDGQARAIGAMRPFDRLGKSSASMAWTSEYVEDDDEEEVNEEDEGSTEFETFEHLPCLSRNV